jgi:hypothetical protein
MKKTELVQELFRMKSEITVLRAEINMLRKDLTDLRIKKAPPYPDIPMYSPTWSSPNTVPSWTGGNITCASGKYPTTTSYDKCGDAS